MPERNAQPFSQQSGGQQRKTIGKFVDAFEAAGHELGPLFAYFLDHTNLGQKHAEDAKASVREVLKEAGAAADHHLDQLLNALRELHSAETTNDRDRLRIMSLIAPIFTRPELLRRGFKVSNDAFAHARKHAATLGPGAPVPTGGRPRVYTPELAATIEEFCNQPDISIPNPAYPHPPPVQHHQLIDPQTGLLIDQPQLEQMLEAGMPIHDAYGNPIELPQQQNHQPQPQQPVLNEHGAPIPARLLRLPISALYTKFCEQHPHLKITYQALRSMMPANIGKRVKDIELEDDEMMAQQERNTTPNTRKKRGRPTKDQIASSSNSSNQNHGVQNIHQEMVGMEGAMTDNHQETVHHMEHVEEHHVEEEMVEQHHQHHQEHVEEEIGHEEQQHVQESAEGMEKYHEQHAEEEENQHAEEEEEEMPPRKKMKMQDE